MDAVKEIVNGYLDAVYWLNDDEQEMGMSDAYLSQDAKDGIYKDCERFFELSYELIFSEDYTDNLDQVGCDLYLTRNGHGAGFWDRDYPNNLGDKLTEIVNVHFSEECYYLSDDGMIERF